MIFSQNCHSKPFVIISVVALTKKHCIYSLMVEMQLKCVSKVLRHFLKASSAHICLRTFETHFRLG